MAEHHDRISSLVALDELQNTFVTRIQLFSTPVDRKVNGSGSCFQYQDESQYYFMENQSYEQPGVNAKILGNDALFLSDNLEVDMLFWNERPIGIPLPTFIEAQIVKCEPGLKGDTVTTATKSATLSTGAIVKVPLFVDKEDWVKVDTRTRSYMG